jgi:hypothetical protein
MAKYNPLTQNYMSEVYNTKIEINDNNTDQTGTYKVYYRDLSNKLQVKVLSEEKVNSLLNMRQKEDFFMGKYKFTIESEFDFKKSFFD